MGRAGGDLARRTRGKGSEGVSGRSSKPRIPWARELTYAIKTR
jgi:hypothetical protein